jgi:hypothetical protein
MNNLRTNLRTKLGRKALVLAVLATLAGGALAQEAGKGGAVRPEVGKPLQAAVELVKAKKNKDALAKLQEADAVANKTQQESYLLERVRGQAAAGAGEPVVAAKSFEAAAGSPAAPAADRAMLLAGAAGQYYVAKDYAKSADLIGRYFKEGGTDPALRMLLVQALYLGNDPARAGEELQLVFKELETAGKQPSEEQLQLYSSICLKRHDSACYTSALEKLLLRFPKQDYWLTAIYELTKSQGFSSRHGLDVARLKLLTNTMRSSGEYFDAAQLSMQEGYPFEAKEIIDRGYSAGLLGRGDEADRHRRLRDMVAKAVAEDTKSLGSDDAAAASAANGQLLLNSGFNYVLRRQFDKGLAMMEQGVRKGGFKRPDDATLRLGVAQVLAGRTQVATQTLASVHGKDGGADLAKLWAVAAVKRGGAAGEQESK